MKHLAVVLLVLFWAVPTAAQVKAVPPGQDDIRELKLKEPAPIAGMLYSPETALRWANYLEQYKQLLPASVSKEKALCQAELTAKSKLAEVERVNLNSKLQTTLTMLDKSDKSNAALLNLAKPPSFWDSRDFGLLLGAGGSILLFVLGGVLLH